MRPSTTDGAFGWSDTTSFGATCAPAEDPEATCVTAVAFGAWIEMPARGASAAGAAASSAELATGVGPVFAGSPAADAVGTDGATVTGVGGAPADVGAVGAGGGGAGTDAGDDAGGAGC